MTPHRARRSTPIGRAASGFTLIEIMIAVTVAAILMAMAAFSLVRARASANEASAIASLKSINNGQVSYNSACGRGYYAETLTILVMPPHAAAAGGYINDDLGVADVVQHDGYRIGVEAGASSKEGAIEDCNGNATVTGYYATAVPAEFGQTGSRSFATNEAGALWQNQTAVAPVEPFGPPDQIAQ